MSHLLMSSCKNDISVAIFAFIAYRRSFSMKWKKKNQFGGRKVVGQVIVRHARWAQKVGWPCPIDPAASE